jgi:hypothetical protein
MDQRGRVDWTSVWRKKMQERGTNGMFDRGEWLASRVRALKPSVWMDASTFAQGVWKDISGSSNHMTETQGVQLMRQEAGPDGVGQAVPSTWAEARTLDCGSPRAGLPAGTYILHTSPEPNGPCVPHLEQG